MNPRVMTNAAVLGALKIGAPLCSLLLVLAVSRTLGAEGLGRYSLAYAYLSLFGLLGPLGLPPLLTREGARDTAALSRLLASGITLGGAVSLLLTVAMAVVGYALSYDPETTRAISVLSLALLPSTLVTYCEATALTLERFAPIAVATAIEHAVKVGGGMVFLVAGRGLGGVLAAAVAGRLAACVVLIWLLRRLGVPVGTLFDRATLRLLAVESPIFALSAVCATLYWRIDVFLLSRLRGLAETGCYTAAYRILDMAILLPQSFCQTVYPRVATCGANELEWRAAALRRLALLTGPIAATVSAVAGPLLTLLYGRSFESAAPTLTILIWTAVPYAWNRYHAGVLVAAGMQRADLGINASLLALNAALNFVLVPRWGATGAAAVTLLTAVVYGAAQFLYLRHRLLRPATNSL